MTDTPKLNVVQLPKPPPAHGVLEALDWLRGEVEQGLHTDVIIIAANREDHVSVVDCAGPSLIRALGLLEAAKNALLTEED